MAVAVLIGFLRDQDRGLDLARLYVNDLCLDVKNLDRYASYAVRTRKFDDGLPGCQRRSGIRLSHAVAGVAADGSDRPDLRTSYHVNRFTENVYVFLNDRVIRDM